MKETNIKRKPKIGDRVVVFKKADWVPTSGTIRHIGRLKGKGTHDSIWSDWDCKRKFFSTGWYGGRNKQEYWEEENYTDKDTRIFLLPEFIELKDWLAEKKWEEARKKERKAYNPLDYDDDCTCVGSCRCKQ